MSSVSAAMLAVLDNEAVQAIADARHPKHRRLLALLEARTTRNRRDPGNATVVAPTAVRVEARVARTDTTAAGLGRFDVRDVALTTRLADRAVSLLRAAPGGPSVVDATVAAAAADYDDAGATVTIFTSDRQDLDRLVAAADRTGTIAVRQL